MSLGAYQTNNINMSRAHLIVVYSIEKQVMLFQSAIPRLTFGPILTGLVTESTKNPQAAPSLRKKWTSGACILKKRSVVEMSTMEAKLVAGATNVSEC